MALSLLPEVQIRIGSIEAARPVAEPHPAYSYSTGERKTVDAFGVKESVLGIGPKGSPRDPP